MRRCPDSKTAQNTRILKKKDMFYTIPVNVHLMRNMFRLWNKWQKENAVQFRSVPLQSKEEAQNAPTPITTYALFYDGAYVTNEQMNDKRFLKLLSK